MALLRISIPHVTVMYENVAELNLDTFSHFNESKDNGL